MERMENIKNKEKDNEEEEEERKERSFEKDLKELEGIVEDLERGELPLKESVNKFKKGAKLLKRCRKELKSVEATVEKMIDEDGEIDLEKFE